jgi:hypothetical protein
MVPTESAVLPTGADTTLIAALPAGRISPILLELVGSALESHSVKSKSPFGA